MQPEAITEGWLRAFGEVAPIGHLCRIALPHRWLRIHNLPRAQRYPACPGDYLELLARQNAVATNLLGPMGNCVLFFAEFPHESSLKVSTLLGDLSVLWPPGLAALTDSYTELMIGALPVEWHPGRFDHLLRARADGELAPLLFANLDLCTAFAPYDGGADLFVQSTAHVAGHRNRWARWLSSREDQL